VGRRFEDFGGDAQLGAKLEERGCTAETLGSQFQQVAFARDGLNDAAGAGRGFKKLGVDTGFAEGVRADEAGDSTADHQCWDVTGHGVVSILAESERFGKERLAADELLFFKIGIEGHGQITDEDAAQPGGANFAAIEEHEAVFARGFEAAQLF